MKTNSLLAFGPVAGDIWSDGDDQLFAAVTAATLDWSPDQVWPGLGPADFASAASGTIKVGNQGALAMQANVATSLYGVTGAGIKIGILSDSFNVKGAMAADIAAGVLPANIDILEEGPSTGTDEGRAMAELIHQVAPGASIDFYSADYSEADFGAGIEALAAAGCNVIVDDVVYFDEPMFQLGSVVDNAIDTVTSEGDSYFTAAGNEGEVYYQGTFSKETTKLPGLTGNYVVDNFGTAGSPMPYETLNIPHLDQIDIDLQWNQPFQSIGTGHASVNSLAMVLYNSAGKIVAKAAVNDVGKDPVQVLAFANTSTSTTYRLAIVDNGGTVLPGTFKFVVMSGGTTITGPASQVAAGSVFGHALDPNANSVGAIAAANAPTLGGSGAVETFSSSGPGQLLFDSSGNKLASPLSVGKVNFVAPDGIQTDVFNPFYGTSAAAPDAAGVAALMLQAQPGLSPTQVTSLLTASTIAVTGGAGQTGAGLVQAPAAVAGALATTPAASVVAVAALTPLASALNDVLNMPAHASFAVLGSGDGGSGFSLQFDPAYLDLPAGSATTASADSMQPVIVPFTLPSNFG